MTKKDLTIIIPCYNMEKYINKCLDSIFNQTYKNFNLIIVDDRSTDNTFKIVKKYEKKYSNIKVIKNKVNSGAGYSRNCALKLVDTKYVTFIDGDDYLDDHYYENFINIMTKEQSDIGICDLYITYEDHKMIDTISTCCEGKINKYNFIVNGLAASPCNKVFKTELFDNNYFAESIINEDIPTVITSLIKAKKISFIPNTYYYYVQHKTSVQNSSLSIKKLDIFTSLNILYERIKNLDYQEYFDGIIFYQVILLLFYIIPKEDNYKKRKEFLNEYYKLSKKYDIYHNSYLPVFLEEQGRRHRYYYQMLIYFVSHNHIIAANNLISFYQFYRENYIQNVLEDEKYYNINNLIEMAKGLSKAEKLDLSIIIPNYNYAKFLYQRMYSILSQGYYIKEIILLDDKSSDNSKMIIDEMVDKLNPYICVKKIYNDKNSGSAFKQWEKGIRASSGKYIWIAEADDYSDYKFLKEVTKKLSDDVILSYVDTGFINEFGDIIQRSVVKDIDILKNKHWNHSYINDGMKEIQDFAYLNCTIANVSSVIFKNIDFEEIFTELKNYKQAGDWLFYLYLMQHGKVSYVNKTLNFYRIHGFNATTLNKKQLQYDEIKLIHQKNEKKFNLNKEQKNNIKNRQEYLEVKWKVK